MRARHAVAALWAGVFMLGLSGCGQPGPKPTSEIVTHREDLRTEPGQASKVDPATKVLGAANKIKVTDIRTTTVGAAMQITVTFKNERGRRDVFNVRMRWLDSAGVMAAQYDPWETVALEGLADKSVTLNAPTPRATDFRIELQGND